MVEKVPIKYKSNCRTIKMKKPADLVADLLKGLMCLGGVGPERAASQKRRAKQICDLELREQPLRRD